MGQLDDDELSLVVLNDDRSIVKLGNVYFLFSLTSVSADISLRDFSR